MSARNNARRAAPISSLPSPPQLTWAGIGITASVWFLYAMVYSTVLTIWAGSPFAATLAESVKQHTILAILSIPVWFLVVRRLDGQDWWVIVFAHMLAAPLYVLAYSYTYIFVSESILTTRQDFLDSFEEYRAWYFLNHLILYLLQFAIIHVVRAIQRARAEEKRADLLASLVHQSELAVLKAQVNPHFLFNTLNSISASVPKEQEETRHKIRVLADLLRYSLNTTERDLVPFQKELEFIDSYLQLEQIRFGDRLEYEFDIAPGSSDVLVPPMLLQPLTENAIRHGIAPRLDGGGIIIKTEFEENRLQCHVLDNGVGICDSRMSGIMSTGIGLKNTDRRLREIYGIDSRLRMERRKNGGLRVSFSIPASIANAHR